MKGAYRKRRHPQAYAKMLARVIERDGTRCHLCGQPVSMDKRQHAKTPTLDHLIPKSRGGWWIESNLKLAHRDCNNRRGNTTLPEGGEDGEK